MQRMRDQAKFQEEIEKRKSMEDQLRAQVIIKLLTRLQYYDNLQMQEKPNVVGDQDLLNQVERLQKIEQQQKLEILRY